MSRGRLIFPKIAQIARYDVTATAAIGAVDPILDELFVTSPNDGSPRTTGRQEVPVQVEAQIETSSFLPMATGPIGDAAGGLLRIVCFMPELEEAGLVDPETGRALLKATDRLDAIYDLDGTTLLLQLPDADHGGWFATQAQPTSFGFGSGANNLVELTFERRAGGVPSGGAGG